LVKTDPRGTWIDESLIDHDLLLNAVGLTNQHSDIDNFISAVPTTYLLLNCNNDPLIGTLNSQHISPNGNQIYDLGDLANYFQTLYIGNNGGKVIDCPTAIGLTARTNYTFDLGGGGNVATEGGDFIFQMDPCVGACENNVVFDVGNVYWAGAGFFNRFKIQSYTGLRTYAFVAAFGGFNNVNYGWELQYVSGLANTAKTLFFDNQTASGPARSIDFKIGTVNKMTIENDGNIIITDRITIPRADITAIQAGSGFGNAGVQAIGATSYLNFFGLNWFDYLTLNAQSTNLPVCLGMFPSGTAVNSYVNVYNSSSTGATAWLEMGVRGAIAELVVRDFAQTTNITTLEIGSGGNDFPTFDVTCTTLIDINFIYAGVTEYNFTTTAFTLSDANNIIFGITTGTKIATATNQKLAFWNAAPIIQPSSTGQTAGYTSVGGGTNVQETDTFTGGVGATAYTIGDIVRHLKNLGLIAI
jgi:hypothetical protein